MQLETERLLLVPLEARQLSLWMEDLAALELELNCQYKGESMTGFFLDIVRGQERITAADPEHYLFHSFWFLIRKSDRTVIGSADFKDVPNDQGIVEIGYGLGTDYEHQGYMTEAVQAMCHWALTEGGVQTVIAETNLDGYASQRVLTRCGFLLDHKGETLWWKRDSAKA